VIVSVNFVLNFKILYPAINYNCW